MSFCNECNAKIDKKFTLLLRKHFTPKMIALGWQGSGLHYRKTLDNHVIQVFSIETSWENKYAKTRQVKCRVGIHFTFLPDVERIRAICCYFSNELSPSRPKPRFIWNYSNVVEENIEMLHSIWGAFQKHSPEFYDDFNSFPHPLDKIRPEDFDSNIANNILGEHNLPHSGRNLALLRDVNIFLGNKALSENFSKREKEYFKQVEEETTAFNLNETITMLEKEKMKDDIDEHLANIF